MENIRETLRRMAEDKKTQKEEHKFDYTDKHIFQQYFFYGINDMEGLKKGIVINAMKDVYNRYNIREIYEIPNVILKQEILDTANPLFVQLIRFIEYNDKNTEFQYEVNNSRNYETLKQKLQNWIENGEASESVAGIFFRKEKEENLAWTGDVYKLLQELRKIEISDNNEYYRIWLITKIKRIENRLVNMHEKNLGSVEELKIRDELQQVQKALEDFEIQGKKTKKAESKDDKESEITH